LTSLRLVYVKRRFLDFQYPFFVVRAAFCDLGPIVCATLTGFASDRSRCSIVLVVKASTLLVGPGSLQL
jgi:hypothetical protein